MGSSMMLMTPPSAYEADTSQLRWGGKPYR